jgi:predicted MFS family arabinose efflux permease
MRLPDEKKTFLLSVAIFLLMGLAFGVFTSADVIAARTLGAGAFSVAVLMFLLNASAIFSLPLTQWMGEGRRRRRALLVMVGVCTLPVFLYPLFPGVGTFIFAIFVVHLLNVVMPPTMNILYRRHFRPGQLGRLFGWTTSAKILAGMAGATVTGVLLDHDDALYQPLLLVAGGLVVLDFGEDGDAASSRSFFRSFIDTARTVRGVLERDRTFFRFERNFIIYGLGFLMLTPVVPVYFVRVLDLDYATISLSRMVVGQTALWMLSPAAGALFDRSSAFGFTGFSYLTLAGYPLLVGLAALLPDAWILVAVFAGYAFYSVGMTGVSISWHIGSIRFAKDADPALYQGVHVTLTGLRSLFGPVLGYVVMTWFGFAAAFGLAAVFFLAAAALMLRDRRAA